MMQGPYRPLRAALAALRCRRSARPNAGVAAVEFAALAPMLVLVFAGTIAVGDAVYQQTRLDAAVAAGINYAVVHAANVSASINSSTGNAYASDLASTIASLVSNANGGTALNVTVVVNHGPTVTITNGTSTPSGTTANASLCYCPTGSPPSWNWGNSVTCASTCGGNSSAVAGKFVTVTASQALTQFFPVFNFGLPTTITIGSAAETQ